MFANAAPPLEGNNRPTFWFTTFLEILTEIAIAAHKARIAVRGFDPSSTKLRRFFDLLTLVIQAF